MLSDPVVTRTNFLHFVTGKLEVKHTSFKSKASAEIFIQEHRIDLKCQEHLRSCTLKCLQMKIGHYLEKKRREHKENDSVGIVTANIYIQFSTLCHGNNDMLIGGSNSSKAIYFITTTFDGVGILGTVTLLTKYLPGWKCVTGLALAGDVLAICVDDIIHYHTPFDNVTHIVSTSDMVPVLFHGGLAMPEKRSDGIM